MTIKIGNLSFPPDPEEMERVIGADFERFSGNIMKKVERAGKVVETQHAIIKHIEAMAVILAEAGRSSGEALGDSPHYAIDKWCNLLRDKAHELLRKPKDNKLIEPPTIDSEAGDGRP